MTSNTKKFMIYTVLLLVVGGAMVGGYYLFQKFLKDRQSAIRYKDRPARPTYRPQSGDAEVRHYTREELEAARQRGDAPPGLANPPDPQPHTTTMDATQRSLKTIEEINKINEMNRRLLQQQQQMQNQR